MAEPKLKLTEEGRFFGTAMRKKFGWVPGSPAGTIPQSVLDQVWVINAINGTGGLFSLGATEAEIASTIKDLIPQLKARPLDQDLLRDLLRKGELRRVLRLLFEQGLIEGVDAEDDELQEAKIERLSSRLPQSMKDELKDIRGY